MLLAFVMTIAFGLVDSFGQTAYALFMASKTSGRPIAITGLVTVALVFLARQFAAYLSVDQSNQRKRVRIPTQVIGFVVGVALAFIVATFWAATAHAILWKGQVPYGDPGQQIIDQIQGKNPQLSLSKDNYIVVAPAAEHEEAIADTRPDPILASVALALVLLINVLTGRTLTFLNLSSIQQFYAARLARAYLGASNPRRTGFGAAPAAGQPVTQDVTEAIEGDDVPFCAYRPEQHGGPIHLINVTINETLAGASQLEQRDRKGLGMAVGPCGISVARVHHAIWAGNEVQQERAIQPVGALDSPFPVFGRAPVSVESLTVKQWVAISGAAFTTGLGARTNLGMSLLLGFSNVRLGYWWDSGIAPRNRTGAVAKRSKLSMTRILEPLFSAQVYLSDEFLARFYGPHRQRWYLSDGGHYENTAAYELIRRRLPFILVSDNGCDEGYTFEDLANLTRKVRIDFNAEIRLLEASELDDLLSRELREVIGTPAELQRRVYDVPPRRDDAGLQGNAYSRCHALLARVYYDGATNPGSVLLMVKPSLAGDEPVDLLQYHASHPTFPQESTMDQFFDEAQWESYRKLGSHIGDKLLDAIGPLDAFTGLLTNPRM
jgi:hypothetical protein